MNKVIKSLVLSGALVVSVLASGNVVSAQSNNNAPLCTRTGIPLSEYGGKNFTVSGNKITAKVKLTGPANCKYDLTLATFKGFEKTVATPPFDIFEFDIPREKQELFSAVSKTVTGPGVHTLTTTIPECIYQADVITGKARKSVVGTSYFSYVNNENFVNQGRIAAGTDTAHIHDATFGGKDVCEKPEAPVAPTAPVAPVAPQAPGEKVSVLPSTGAGSVLASALGLSTTTGLAYNLIASRKKLK